ncbi:MAG: type II toxin-antitoxin system VapC family toxin [Burkholderiales bacterium]
MQSILVDAGPLIALINPADKHHRVVKSHWRRFDGRRLTTWPVLAEVCHFLPEPMQIGLLRWAEGGGISVVEMHETALSSLADWKEKYSDLPMDLADASLIWVAHQTGVLDILTIDRKDFSVYRMPGGKALNLVL